MGRAISPLVIAVLALASVAACGGSSATLAPSGSPRPSPTPVQGDPRSPVPGAIVVGGPFDAGSLVVASNPQFAGIGPRREDVVGQGSYWVATPLDGGRFRIDVTIGWGDCQAGCIERHVWTYEVWPDGRLELVNEEGPEVPQDVR
jgi:hypothetical protein